MRFCGSPDCTGPHECLAVEYVGGGGMVSDASFTCSGPAVTFAPDGWDDKTESPVDEQAESLRHADPPPEPDSVIAECQCWVTPEWQWTKHYGAVEPGSQWEPNPECPVHFPGTSCDGVHPTGEHWEREDER